MKNNIIDFASAKTSRKLYNSKELGTITISVLLDSQTNNPYFYLLPDREELLPLVDVLEDTLLKHVFISK